MYLSFFYYIEYKPKIFGKQIILYMFKIQLSYIILNWCIEPFLNYATISGKLKLATLIKRPSFHHSLLFSKYIYSTILFDDHARI